MRRALAAVVAALSLASPLGGCGVKGPPRPSGAPEKDPPHEVFRSSGGARP